MLRIANLLRTMSQFLLLDRMVQKLKNIADAEPSLDQALEQHQKAIEKVRAMEAVIATKHKRYQDVINRLNKEE